MATNPVGAFTSERPKFVTKPLPPPATTINHSNGNNDGPSWGLIIPIIMIGIFLTSVAVCLWWHKWRDKRTLHISRDHNSGSSFHRSYRCSRSNRSGFDAVRDSTRSTTPLRGSANEKIAKSHNNVVKVKNVNVIPIQQKPGKYAYTWDKNQWKTYQTPTTALSSSGRLGTKPLSPINEIESPSSMKLSELSRNYDISAQASFSPYHLAWYSSSNPPPPYERSGSHSQSGQSKRYPPITRRSVVEQTASQNNAYEPEVSSPFYPNNNTPTTECETGSETSQTFRDDHHQGYQYTSYPSSPKSSIPSISNTRLTVSTETDINQTSTSYPESSFQTCTTSYEQSYSGCQTSTNPSGLNNLTEQTSTNLSSLPSSIAQFSKQNLLMDDNNNSMVAPNVHLTFPMAKILNYTLASSVTSSDTHASENTSLLPNIGSNNTSSYPGVTGSRSYPHSTAPTSPEDLSKLVDEMSSIRPVEESSIRPNSSVEPSSRIVSISGNSVLTDLQSSWSVLGEMERSSAASTNTESQPSLQNGSLYWDNYPWAHAGVKSYPELPLQMHDSFVQQAQRSSFQRPVLMETQYWV
ncbi:mucin-2-like [Ruditapes philippinarum]|uniref:mucin-2-like n=1 Tax=Ruditapes philippinarum TaxID=129788 RepID=UPI00295B8378|nr:mucin-2-like [Ruditapes philippinarum]